MTKNEMIQKLLSIALKEVGYLEKKSGKDLYEKTANAGSANYTKYGYEMHKLYPTTMDYPAAWCDCFVDWCFVQAFGEENAKKLLHGFDDYTVSSSNLFKRSNEWRKTPEIGDQIFFTNSSGGICHTGLVYNVSNGYVYTVEGNTSSASYVVANGGAVAKKCYALNYHRIAGYGRPNYMLIAKEDELSMAQYNELKSLINEQNKIILELISNVNTLKADNSRLLEVVEDTFIYNWVDDNMPDWAKPAVIAAMNCGAIKGDSNGELRLSYKDLRNIVREYRVGIYDKPVVHK